MVVIALSLVRMRNLIAVVMLTGIFSLLASSLYVVLDAVDVAFTEAAVGAGIATVLMLGTLALTPGDEKVRRRNNLLPLAVVVATGAMLVYGTLDMPGYGDPEAPIHKHVVPRYIEKSSQEVGPPNIVTSVLASYRGYDTLGEVTVVFTAAAGVLMLLGYGRRQRETPQAPPKRNKPTMRRNAILRITAKILIPFILLFALYVQFHGDYGPGGGFQAGVIFGSAFILYALIFGIDTAHRVVPAGVLRLGLPAGLLLYAGVGVAGLLLGANYLNYSVLAGDPLSGQHLGINLIEFGVGITVAASMTAIFYLFAGRED